MNIFVRVPVQLVRKRGRKLIFMPDAMAPVQQDVEPDSFLVQALLRAHEWNKVLESGKVASIVELAEREKVSQTYLGRVLRLNLLAPDIKQAILDGHNPKRLRVVDMFKPFPLVWQEQREWFGFFGEGSDQECRESRSKVSSTSGASSKKRSGARSGKSRSDMVMS